MQREKRHGTDDHACKGTGESHAVQGKAGIAKDARAVSSDDVAARHPGNSQCYGGDKALQWKAECEVACRGGQRRRARRGVAHGDLG